MSRYAESHRLTNLAGGGDARPTALQIIKDEELIGRLSDKVFLITGVPLVLVLVSIPFAPYTRWALMSTALCATWPRDRRWSTKSSVRSTEEVERSV
jgi:hypothetical protein